MSKYLFPKQVLVILVIVMSLFPMYITTEGKGGPLPPIMRENNIEFVPLTNTGYEDLVYILSSRPILLAFIDFRDVDNSSISRILKRTSYSYEIAIPSNRVYVKKGELYVDNVKHLIIEEEAFRKIGIRQLNLSDNIMVVAYIRIIEGKDYSYARSGIGFYGKTSLFPGNRYAGAGYWLSVLGSFTGRKLSYDFEGHWSKLNGRWFSSSTYRKFKYNYNTTYILWIAKSGKYIVGGVLDDAESTILRDKIVSTIMSYVEEENVYKIDITAYKSKIAIKRIEIYRLEPIGNSHKLSIKLIEPVIYSSRYALLQPNRNKVLEFTFHRYGRTVEFGVHIRNK